MKSVLKSKPNKEKSTEIFPPRLLKPPYICACAMPRAKKGQQKDPTLNTTTELCPSRCYYSMGQAIARVWGVKYNR